jgi:hypothetical protein
MGFANRGQVLGRRLAEVVTICDQLCFLLLRSHDAILNEDAPELEVANCDLKFASC